jgi:hypothetical protein
MKLHRSLLEFLWPTTPLPSIHADLISTLANGSFFRLASFIVIIAEISEGGGDNDIVWQVTGVVRARQTY